MSVQTQPSTLKAQPSILDADHGVPRGEVTYNINRIKEFIDNQQGNVFISQMKRDKMELF